MLRTTAEKIRALIAPPPVMVTSTDSPSTCLEVLLYLVDEGREVDSVDPGNPQQEPGLAELRVDEILQVVGARVLEEQELLRDQQTVLGDRVVLGLALVQRLVDLLQGVSHRYGLADGDRAPLEGFRVDAQLFHAIENSRIVKAVLAARLQLYLQCHAPAHGRVDELCSHPHGLGLREPGHGVPSEAEPQHAQHSQAQQARRHQKHRARLPRSEHAEAQQESVQRASPRTRVGARAALREGSP